MQRVEHNGGPDTDPACSRCVSSLLGDSLRILGPDRGQLSNFRSVPPRAAVSSGWSPKKNRAWAATCFFSRPSSMAASPSSLTIGNRLDRANHALNRCTRPFFLGGHPRRATFRVGWVRHDRPAPHRDHQVAFPAFCRFWLGAWSGLRLPRHPHAGPNCLCWVYSRASLLQNFLGPPRLGPVPPAAPVRFTKLPVARFREGDYGLPAAPEMMAPKPCRIIVRHLPARPSMSHLIASATAPAFPLDESLAETAPGSFPGPGAGSPARQTSHGSCC